MSTQPRAHSADDHRADLDFYFDPVCPFAWMTSKWVRMVAEQRDYTVDWRFISLRMINAHIDYDAHFPAGYKDGHTAGLKMLRVAARARIEAKKLLGQHVLSACASVRCCPNWSNRPLGGWARCWSLRLLCASDLRDAAAPKRVLHPKSCCSHTDLKPRNWSQSNYLMGPQSISSMLRRSKWLGFFG